MTAYPVLRSLTISDYGLYPPSMKKPFVVDFQPGPNLVVGVNGSGKTTLISICLRCLTGPYDLPSATSETELGQVRPRAIPMSRYDRSAFGRRVADGAKDATASLTVAIGSKVFEITRRLSDLSLVSVLINGKAIKREPTEAEQREDGPYHTELAKALGVATFFDILIILRFLTFMLEDRRALVWDPTAQRQIFRVLLLTPNRATEYATAQQELVSADSAVRNTANLITRQENFRRAAARQTQTIADAEAERRVLAAEVGVLRDQIEAVSQARVKADDDRRAARLARMEATEARERSSRDLERMKMEAVGRRLEPSQTTLRYIVSQLLADRRCLVCDTTPSPAADVIEDRLRKGLCPVCGSHHTAPEKVVPLSELDRVRILRLESEIGLAEQQIADAETRLEDAQSRLAKAETEFESLQGRRIARDQEMVSLLKRIPADRAAVVSADDSVDALQRILTEESARRTAAEERFRVVSAESLKQVQKAQDGIASTFQQYLHVFLKEEATLVYQTIRERVGQAGSLFDFPAFRLAMTSGAMAGPTIRELPDSVSQSQSEFVDLAFRMALMTETAEGGSATLVVDAPEASLDFLFAERAGEQLAKFSRALPDNRVIVTSYLPSAHLVRAFLKGVRAKTARRARIVDLIRYAAPNAAIRADGDRYKAFLEDIIENPGQAR